MDHGERKHRLVVVAELEPVFLAVVLRAKLFQFIRKELLADARALIDGDLDALPVTGALWRRVEGLPPLGVRRGPLQL